MEHIISFHELTELLNELVIRFNTPEFVETDPVQFPRRYSLKQDVEVSAFLTATITWGKRSIILKSADHMHRLMGISPYDFIMGKGYEDLEKKNIHRTFFEDDMAFICRGLRAIYQKYESIETLFSGLPTGHERIWNALRIFRDHILTANGTMKNRSIKHISDPGASACKRLHLALKWLVRNDGIVDIGLWKNISPSELFIPLDVHVGNSARQLGLLKRKANDRDAVTELTENLRIFNPDDPVVYDFALFGIGEQKLL